ncbi:MAG: hypothetical protein AAFR61_00500 [Bacteroidota bacterium]
MNTIWISLISLCTLGLWPSAPAQAPTSSPVNNIIKGVPKDLSQQTLLIPRFEFLDVENAAPGERRDFIVRYNKAAKKSNTSLNEAVMKNYPFEYKLINLQHVQALKEEGYRYYMDMVLMPKQMDEVKVEAMIPTYEKYESASRMYRNKNTMWHYYFYIRDLETNDAYITSKLGGNWDVYRGIGKFMRQVKKDAVSGK